MHPGPALAKYVMERANNTVPSKFTPTALLDLNGSMCGTSQIENGNGMHGPCVALVYKNNHVTSIKATRLSQ
jgi:hypothetical protein